MTRDDELPLVLDWRIRASALYQLVLGMVILIGGPARFSSVGLFIPRTLMPYWAWGATFLTLGLLTHAAISWSRRALEALLFIAAMPLMVFAIAVLASAGRSPVAGLTGGPTYAFVAVSHILSGIGLRYGSVTVVRG